MATLPSFAAARKLNLVLVLMACPQRNVLTARALLGWSQSDLARRSGISEPTIARRESVDGQLGGREETVRKIRGALENSGIEFIEENGGGPGVRLRKRHQRKG
jgi:transcriptional regulator with XRE-family HTH domain